MIVITGDSHLGALRRGGPEHPGVTFWPLGRGGAVPTPFYTHDAAAGVVQTHVHDWRNRTFSRAALTFDGAPALVAVSLPLNTSRILRGHSWQTHVPWQLLSSADEIALSDAVLQALCEQDNGHAVAFVGALVACGLKVVAIEAPRFFADAPYLATTRREVCLHVDTLYRQTVSARLAAMGVDVIAQRPETLTEEGLTRDAFNNENPEDTHHANAAFGAMMFEDIVAYGTREGFV